MALDLQFFAPFASAVAGGWATRKATAIWLGPVDTPPGWTAIRPSSMHWFGLVGAGSIVSLMAYVGLFIGSARADAEFQMRMLWLLVVAFTGSAMVCLYQMRRIVRTAARWRGTQLSFLRTADGQRVTYPLSEVAGLHRPYFGHVQVHFNDGQLLLLDPYADKVPELWNRIVEVNED
jgi:hypothetical protein